MLRRLSLATVLLLAACSGGVADGSGGGDERLPVVATTSVIADLVANVGADRVEVVALVPAGGEPHTFDPAPSDVTRLSDAAIVFGNGLALDGWLDELVAETAPDAPIVHLGEDLDAVDYLAGGHDEHDDEADEHADQGLDPHLWLDVSYARLYVERIADELAAIDPDGAAAYRLSAAAYDAQLAELDAYARETLGTVPPARRAVVSFHEAFGYFARAYGLTIVDTVVDAPGQDPSAGEVAGLVDAIRESGAAAILAEAQFPTELVERIADETGVAVVNELHSDSLGDSPADSYLGMMRANVDRIAGALR